MISNHSTAGYPTNPALPSHSHGPPQPIVAHQPQQHKKIEEDEDGVWMPAPTPFPGCPQGLEYLAAVDQLMVHQKIEVLELIYRLEQPNKYIVKNIGGQKIFKAQEIMECRCGPCRPFDMQLTDSYDNEIIHLRRDLNCCCWLTPCCLQKIEVSSPPGNVIGTVEQQWTFNTPKLMVKDASGTDILKIKGPGCMMGCGENIDFHLFTVDNRFIGKITKQWGGFEKEFYTDADNFGMNFPIDLEVKAKATLLGALFLIDYMYFEDGQSRSVRRFS